MAQGAGLAVEFLAGRGFHHALHSKYVAAYFVVISNCVNHTLPHGAAKRHLSRCDYAFARLRVRVGGFPHPLNLLQLPH